MSQTLKTKPEIAASNDRLKSIFEKAFSEVGLRAGKHGWKTIKTLRTISRSGLSLVVAWMLEDVTENRIKLVQELKRPKIFLVFKGRLPCQAAVDRVTLLNVRDPRRIHCIASEEDEEEAYAERLFQGLDNEDDANRILDIWWEEKVLAVISPSREGFKKLRIPLDKIRCLRGKNQEQLRNYQIDEDGLFVYWPDLDVHLGWDQFEQAVNRKAVLKARQQSEEFNRAYGCAIRKLRKETGLLQSDIKGLTARQVGRIERGECRATYAALSKLAQAHKLGVSDYMDRLAELL